MNDQEPYRMSHGLDVLPPKADKAYPIACEEWEVLKNRIAKMQLEPWLFHTIGSIFLGAALSTFSSILLGAYSTVEQQRALTIAWAVVSVTGVCGVACLVFAHKERDVQRERAADIVTQMSLIEKRFDK